MELSFRSPLIAEMIRRAQKGECDEFFKKVENQEKIVAGLGDVFRLNESLQNARRVDQDLLMHQISI